MKITRRFHACVEYSEADTTIIVDPGSFEVPDNLDQADAILITHIHPDHVAADAVDKAKSTNPDLQIFGPAELATQISSEFTTVAHGDVFSVGNFTVEVYESPHATIIQSKELPQNLGYIFNGKVFQPGDSYPAKDPALAGIDTVLIATSAPWMRMLNVDDYLAESRPPRFIGIHDGMDSKFGLATRRGLLTALADDHRLTYIPLDPGDSTEA